MFNQICSYRFENEIWKIYSQFLGKSLNTEASSVGQGGIEKEGFCSTEFCLRLVFKQNKSRRGGENKKS